MARGMARAAAPCAALLLCGAWAAASARPGGRSKGWERRRVDEMTEAELEQQDKMRSLAKCQACEDVVEMVEHEMRTQGLGHVPAGHGDDGSQAKKRKRVQAALEARAIEIIESVCDQHEHKLYCEEAVERVEEPLMDYVRANRIAAGEDAAKEKICASMCEWKSSMRRSIKEMNEQFEREVVSMMPFSTRLNNMINAAYKDHFWVMCVAFGVALGMSAAIQVHLHGRRQAAALQHARRLRKQRQQEQEQKQEDTTGAAAPTLSRR
eukprot:TRINITY_DN1097_c1_g1_i1.p1 TRINITY_DN1097_c1_g1~~TRINITY_DN1097_c1_g1_i1.p1  ORF type:complete len:266 (+),score=76.11 TRINITY_DN1097_c1_g1_i1:63-860(+)